MLGEKVDFGTKLPLEYRSEFLKKDLNFNNLINLNKSILVLKEKIIRCGDEVQTQIEKIFLSHH